MNPEKLLLKWINASEMKVGHYLIVGQIEVSADYHYIEGISNINDQILEISTRFLDKYYRFRYRASDIVPIAVDRFDRSYYEKMTKDELIDEILRRDTHVCKS